MLVGRPRLHVPEGVDMQASRDGPPSTAAYTAVGQRRLGSRATEKPMALPHANPLDIVSISPLGEALADAVSTSLIKTQRLQLLHLVLRAHEGQPEHHVDDECTVHCLEGVVEVVTPGGVRQLRAGNLVLLPGGQKHSLRARTDCAVLVTLLLERGDAAHGGGTGARTLRDPKG
jgi:quercetin dioxygenase-like cupin family protein